MSAEIFYFLTFSGSPGVPDDRVYRGPLRADGFDRVSPVAVGLDRDWLCRIAPVGPIELLGSDPTTLAFTGTESLSGTIWAGQSGPSLATITGAWLDATTGYCRWSLAASGSAALVADQVYNLRLQLEATDDDGARTFVVHDGLVRALPSPGGSAVATGPLYCSAADIDAEAPWTGDERPEYGPLAGWAIERDRASRWIDSIIETRAMLGRIARVSWPGDAPVNIARPWDPVLLPSTDWTSDIRDALADGRMDTSDVRLVRAAALYSLSLIRSQQTDADARNRYRRDAYLELLAFRAKLDLDDDGVYETVITA